MKQTSMTRPEPMSLTKGISNWHLAVCYNITERPATEEEAATLDGETAEHTVFEFDCANVSIEQKPKDYDALVAALVRTRFSADAVEAIVQNYINSKTAEHKEEWNELQAWRSEAKAIAKDYFEGKEDAS